VSLGSIRFEMLLLLVVCALFGAPAVAAETVTVSYEAGTAGTPYHASFSWTVTEVLEQGTFADGSPWVRVAAGSQLVGVTPSSEYRMTSAGMSVAVNGSAKNPRMQMYWDPQTLEPVTVGKQLFDGRRIFLSGPSSQAELDATFDFAANIGMPDPATGLIAPVPLAAGDVVVTAVSRWREDGSVTWTSGGSLPNGDPGRRTAIDRFGVLTVLATAPTAPSFRPPLQWRPGQESSRPAPIPVSSVISNESALLHSGGMDHTGVELLLTSPAFHDGHGILYQSSQAQYALSADPSRQGSIVYGANLSKLVLEPVLFAATDSSLPPATRASARNRLIQYGIDCYGAAMSLGNTRAGAGQRAGEMKPWILLAGWWLNRAEMRDVFGSIRTRYAGTSVAGLSDGELGRMLFHEDHVAVQVQGGMGLGEPYHQVWGPGQAHQVTGSSTAGSVSLLDAGTLFGQFGRMDISGARQHPGVHARHPYKYYGCSLVVEGGAGAGSTVYRVVEVGEVNGGIGSYVIVDRPWQNGGPDATSTVRMFPFRNGDFVPGLTSDVGRWYFSTKGQSSMPGVDCLSPVSDSYARVSFKALVAPYAALKRLSSVTGSVDYLRGNAWHLLAESIGGTGWSPVDGQFYGSAPDSERIYSQIWSSWSHAQLRVEELAVVKTWLGDDGSPSGFGHVDRRRLPGTTVEQFEPSLPDCVDVPILPAGITATRTYPGEELEIPWTGTFYGPARFAIRSMDVGIAHVKIRSRGGLLVGAAIVSDCEAQELYDIGWPQRHPDGGTWAEVLVDTKPGRTFYLIVGGFTPFDCGKVSVDLTLPEPPDGEDGDPGAD